MKYNIKIIVEGQEEEMFFNVVKEVGTHELFNLDIEDASGYGNIADAFLIALRDDFYDCVICVYDVDNRIKDNDSPYAIVRSELMSIFGNEEVADAVSFCTNPNILQYILLFADVLTNVSLNVSSKKTNSEIIHKYWKDIASDKKDDKGRRIKSDYNASLWQLDIIKYSIINGEYPYNNMLENAKELNTNYKDSIPAGNLLPLLEALKKGDKNFFEKISDLTNSISD